MTAVQRSRTTTGVRWGQVYGLDVIDHASWMADPDTARTARNDYVGQTRQKGRARENQHRDDKPWEDLIVGSRRVLWEGWCTNEELDDIERRFIQDPPDGRRPRLNWKLNEDNPEQIPLPRQLEQRHQRDAVRGDPPWQPTEYRPETYGYRPAPKPSLRARYRAMRPWQRKTVDWLAAWLTVTGAGWIALVWFFDFTVWWHPAAVAFGTPPALVAAGWLARRILTSKKPRRRRKAHR